MHNLQLDGNFSDTQMRLIARFIRHKTATPHIIESKYETALTNQHELFTDLYQLSHYQPPEADASHIPMVFCTDTTALLRRVAALHHRTVRQVHHGVDAGGGFTKFAQTIEFEPSADDIVQPDNGRRRVLFTAILPAAAESYHLFSTVYKLLRLPTAETFHSFLGDCKAIAISTGIDIGASSHSCPFCEAKLTVDRTLLQQLTSAKLRTCNSNRHHFTKLKAARRSKPATAAKQHKNCINSPLAMFPQTTQIISWCRLPQVHLHLSLNWYIDRIEKQHPQISSWYQTFHQTRSDYHGGDFQGPQTIFANF